MQVSLAAGFCPGEVEWVAWYNVLSFRFMQQTDLPVAPPIDTATTVAAMLERCSTQDKARTGRSVKVD